MRAVAPTFLGSATGGRLFWLVTVGVAALGLVLATAKGIEHILPFWHEPEYSHAWLIPPLSALVLWWRRDAILAQRGPGSWLGFGLVLLGIVLTAFAELTAFYRIQALAFLVLLPGLGLAALGWRAMRLAWIPLLFLVFAFPLPGAVYSPLSLGLQLLSSRLGAGMLSLLGISVYLDGNVIDLGSFKMQVAEACNGLRYLFPLAAFGFICAWLYRAPLWARVLLLASTVPITVVMNSARIAATGLIIEHAGTRYAEGFLHLFEGWAVFLAALAVLVAEMWLLARILRPACRPGRSPRLRPAAWPTELDRPDDTTTPTSPPRPFVAAAGLLLGAALAQGALGAVAEHPPARPGLVTFPLHVGEWQGRPSTPDAEALQELALDDYALVDFTAPGEKAPVNLWVAYFASQRGTTSTHSPDACLPGAGWEFAEQGVAAAPEAVGGFPVNRGVFVRGDERLLVYYWFEQRGRRTADIGAIKWLAIWDLFRQGRTDGALVRLVTPIALTEPVAEAEARLQRFLTTSYATLERHVGA